MENDLNKSHGILLTITVFLLFIFGSAASFADIAYASYTDNLSSYILTISIYIICLVIIFKSFSTQKMFIKYLYIIFCILICLLFVLFSYEMIQLSI